MDYKSKDKLISLCPDFYLRYFSTFEIIKKIKGNKPCNVLDVGGRNGILGDFIKNEKLPYKLTILDILPNDKNNPTTCDNYLTIDFFKQEIPSYDFIISLDTLEHIFDKEKFIKKILSKSKNVIISAPFDSLEVTKTEKIANDFYKTYKKSDHPWLKEHFQSKLPQEKWFENFLKKQNCHIVKIGSNNINNWLSFMLPNFLPSYFKINNPDQIEEINQFYNQNYQKLGDSISPTYRNIYFISQNKSILNKLNLIPTNLIDPILKTQFISKIINFFNQEIKNINIKFEDTAIELNNMKKHSDNLQKSLDEIRSAKFFKLWQTYCHIKENPRLIIKGSKYFLKFGPQKFIKKTLNYNQKQENILEINQQYQVWFKQNWPNHSVLKKQVTQQKNFKFRPKISIITPVYNPDKQWLESCINSVINQTYDNWELCLADDNSTQPHVKEVLKYFSQKDSRIKVVYRPQNGHISKASNSALKIATGEFIALLDHDDDLAPHALFKVVETINQNLKIDLIYSDEDKLELNGQHVDPFFKPDWSPDMLLSTNYLCHLSVIRKKLIDQIDGFRIGYEGSQDYDLFLRITEKTKNIYHIPDILYSWRKVPGSTATTYSVKNYANLASIKALNDALNRRKIKAQAENGLVEGIFRVKYKIIDTPLVSIIIPTKDKVNYLKKCIKSILDKSTYQNYEILIIDTGSVEDGTKNFYKTLSQNIKIKIFYWQEKLFNYSSVNNFGVEKAKGEYVLLLNNDTEIISPDWIESMLEHAQRKTIGAVGAKLLYPNHNIQHAGVILGIGGVANHASLNLPDNTAQAFPVSNSKDMIRNFSAVTAACLMISKSKYLQVKGLDPQFRIAFNDIDFCLKLSEKGYLNLYTPFAKLYHHESISVGKPEQGNRNLEEFQKEINIMIKKWDYLLKHDPFYNKNLSLKNEKFELKI